MKPIKALKGQLKGLEGLDYGSYQSLRGEYTFPNFNLYIDQIPKDPYAPPGTGIFRVRIKRDGTKFLPDMTDSKIKKIGLQDYLARNFFKNCKVIAGKRRGTGFSGIIAIAEPGQAVLERSSVLINSEFVEVRFFIGLPAEGRAISAKIADEMLCDQLPEIVRLSLFMENLNKDELYRHIETAEDAEFLRDKLHQSGLVAFVADGTILPRVSGVDERPLSQSTVVPFHSPESMRVEMELPNRGKISGMGVPEGVTLIVGGGYHGKSTLLRSMELGVYNHIPGDGREYCVSLPETIKVRASDGRSVAKTDISNFINNLPLQVNTRAFSTANASGSTSQAAIISEAIEVGAKVLLLDEDTCAANFMIRDKRMQQLVEKEDEPITAFIDTVRLLFKENGISTVLVMGGSGDYFDVADHVIQMREFIPIDVGKKAREISERIPTGRTNEGGRGLRSPANRIPIPETLNPRNEYNKFRISASAIDKLVFGRRTIDLSDVEQLVEKAQTKAIGRAIEYAKKYMSENITLAEVVGLVMKDIDMNSLDILDERLTGDLVAFRGLEFASVINRIRDFDVKQSGD